MIIKMKHKVSIIKRMENIAPNSSEIAEKTISLDTSGIYFGEPRKIPEPNHPPVPMANKDWAI